MPRRWQTDRMRRSNRTLTDAERDAKAPPRWLVWRLTKANLAALVTVFFAFALVGGLVIYNGHQDETRDDRQSADRRGGICLAIVEVGPDALARALQQDPTDPRTADALVVYRRDLFDALGFCPGARP